MSDRNLDENGFVIEPTPEPEHLDPAMVAACTLCDPDGYRGGRVCDHHDRSHQRGSAIAREALDAARKDRS